VVVSSFRRCREHLGREDIYGLNELREHSREVVGQRRAERDLFTVAGSGSQAVACRNGRAHPDASVAPVARVADHRMADRGEVHRI